MARPRKGTVKFTTNAESLALAFGRTMKDLDSSARSTATSLARQAHGFYQQSVSTWRKKPQFIVTFKKQADAKYDFEVGTGDKEYRGIDSGTGIYGEKRRRYLIVPRRAKFLRFYKTYIPATKPSHPNASVNTLRPGVAASGGDLRYAKKVSHPGIKPRYFSRRIQRWVNQVAQDRLKRDVWNAIKDNGWR